MHTALLRSDKRSRQRRARGQKIKARYEKAGRAMRQRARGMKEEIVELSREQAEVEERDRTTAAEMDAVRDNILNMF
jgi:hypothetical protein